MREGSYLSLFLTRQQNKELTGEGKLESGEQAALNSLLGSGAGDCWLEAVLHNISQSSTLLLPTRKITKNIL